MIKHTVKYKDYDGNDTEREFWFNLDAGEIALLELSKKEGLSEWLRVAQENEDPTIVGPAFEKIVLGAVGRREGEKFIKDQAAIDALRWTGAYSELIIWMLTNPVEAADFVNGMMPAAAQEALKSGKDELVQKMQAKVQEMSLNTEPSVFPVDAPRVIEVPVSEENIANVEAAARPLAADFAAMSPEEFEIWKQNNA